MRAPNEDLVLQSFYQERQNRCKAPKRHSLLQKNVSYFSNSTPDQSPNVTPSSQKHSERKKNLKEY